MTALLNFVNAAYNLSESVPDSLAHLTSLKNRIVECGGTMDDSMYKVLVFRGLPSDYDVIKEDSRINGLTNKAVSPEDVKGQILEQYRVSQQEAM